MKDDNSHYTLICLTCGQTYDDTFDGGFLLTCGEQHPPSLLRAQYAAKTFEVRKDLPGMFRYANWLPVRKVLLNAPQPAVFQSHRLGAILGLERLFIIFNGYWPEKGALMETGTFKELEAPAVCARMSEQEQRTLVISSAGNTGRAFLRVCSENAIPAVVVIPECGLSSLWLTRKKHPCAKVVAVTGNADYADAIELGGRLAEHADG